MKFNLRSFSCLPVSLLACSLLSSPVRGQQLLSVDWIELDKGVDQLLEEASYSIRDLRRGFQRYPELPDFPLRTLTIVGRTLEAQGFRVARVENSIVGTLRGGRPGPGVALRLEMDAIRIKNPVDPPRVHIAARGVRHALGNDAQLAFVSAAARIFRQLQDKIPGSIRIIVESGSTTFKGATALIQRSALEDEPEIEILIGVKMAPLAAGQVGIHRGQATAAADLFELELRGKLTAETFARQLAEIAQSLGSPPTWDQAAFFDGPALQAGSIDDVVIFDWKDESEETLNPFFTGSLRASDTSRLEQIRARFQEQLEPFSESLSLRFPVDPVPPVRNDPELAERAIGYLKDALGADRVLELATPNPFVGDDFSEFQTETKLLLLWLGVANPEKGIRGVPGEADFNIDEDSLMTGLTLFTKLPLRYMSERVNEVVRSGGQGR